MLPGTNERVTTNTSAAANDDIARQTRESIWRHVSDGSEGIELRLEELNREWDVERALETGAATISLVGLALGSSVDRRFFALPGLVAGFLLQHALQGWCPPLPFLRRLGVRTQSEIEQERYALKAIRGDFTDIEARSGRDSAPVQQALEAVNL